MKNDFLTLIRTRRSIRAYRPDAVPADVLARVLEAGTYAPSAMGAQSAMIVAAVSAEARARLTELNAAVIGKDTDPYYGAPVIVVVLGDGGRLCRDGLAQLGVESELAPAQLLYQNAVGVGLAAEHGTPVSAQELAPVYLRISQAERERNARLQQEATQK